MAKAEIETSPSGYRSVVREKPLQGPPMPDKIAALEATIAQLTATVQLLTAQLAKQTADLAGMVITGPGFSGSGPRGIRFNPKSTGAGGGGGGGGTLVAIEMCDGGTGEVPIFNYVPGP